MSDPVSWLQIAQGWSVLASDGARLGTVAQVTGDKNSDIFDGLALQTAGGLRYVPAEQVGEIRPREVTLTLAAADVDDLEPFTPPPPQTTWRPPKPTLASRISDWLRGRR
jgi:hypothetical protein